MWLTIVKLIILIVSALMKITLTTVMLVCLYLPKVAFFRARYSSLVGLMAGVREEGVVHSLLPHDIALLQP